MSFWKDIVLVGFIKICKFTRIISLILWAFHIFYTRNSIHPSIYICKRSGNVKNMITESKFLANRNQNITIYPTTDFASVFADIVWRRKHYEVKNFYNLGLIRPYQSVNHILNEGLMGSKGRLTKMFRAKKKELNGTSFSDTFYPPSFLLKDKIDREAFISLVDDHISENRRRRISADADEEVCDIRHDSYWMLNKQEGEEESEISDDFYWMLKPVSLSGGTGIKILTKKELLNLVNLLRSDNFKSESIIEMYEGLQESLKEKNNVKFLIQKYIHNPLLVMGRKFSIRCYFLIASLNPLRVFLYNEGRTATATEKYELSEDNLGTNIMHLTNVHQQKGSKIKYSDIVMWNLTMLEDYLVKEGVVKKGWLENKFLEDVKEIVEFISRTFVENIDTTRQGLFFGMYGLDFLLDEDLKVILTEVQTNFGMKIKNPIKRRMMQSMMEEMIGIVYEIQVGEKTGKLLKDISARENFLWVSNDAE